MNTFIVGFHQEDNVDSMQVQKLTEAEFEKSTSGGIRRLFELDTNIGFFVFLDAEDEEGDVSHLVLKYEEDAEDAEDPSDFYSFSQNDFYEFMALYLHGIDELEEEEESEEYGPVHHLAHLLHHIVEEGNAVKP
ncbi:cytosolic protein [Peribacillus asahii]|uniref:Uncharacterized protein n=1 Tax=Peribacillus asahii TaxID=228899 RepID=A0A3Q9RP56_9BACI|nr:cytosolic protein [Peribacillus asahii]AZV43162.1 hypothetical protein BAOM_2553 [Peribacillus asahii]USK83260.1 cytosolic protein [Peribacillus asahii]